MTLIKFLGTKEAPKYDANISLADLYADLKKKFTNVPYDRKPSTDYGHTDSESIDDCEEY